MIISVLLSSFYGSEICDIMDLLHCMCSKMCVHDIAQIVHKKKYFSPSYIFPKTQ